MTPSRPDLAGVLSRLDALSNLETLSSSGIAAGRTAGLSLGSMRELSALLGDPQETFPSIHLTGTNGKGSVGRFLTSLLVEQGLSVGTYSSPHLYRVNERMTWNGAEVSDVDLAEVLDAALAVAGLGDTPPSWFEVVTAAAFRWFADLPVEVAVVEVGLLGRYDATNVVDADVAVITNIAGDHTDFAPGWEVAVASEKAGIVTPGRDVVLGAMPPELRRVVETEGPGRLFAEGVDFEVLDDRLAVGGRVVDVGTPWCTHRGVFLPVHGRSQSHNFAVSLCAAEAFFDRALDPDAVVAAAAGVTLPGRCEVLGVRPLVVFDGAHNAAAAEMLGITLQEEFSPVGSRILVVGMLAGRDPVALLRPLLEVGFDRVVATEPDSARALPAAELAAAAASLGHPADVVVDPGRAVAEGLAGLDEEDMAVIAGSFYLASSLPARLRSPRPTA